MGRRRAQTVANHDAAELLGVVDTDVDRARELAIRHGCRDYGDPDTLFAAPEIDSVFICTPNSSHERLAIAALRQGKHVICEKPLACTPVEAEAMVLAAERHGVTLKVGSNLRLFANVRKAHDLVTSGQIGDLLFLRGSIGNNGWPRDGWFADPALSGGGTVIDNGCHMFDLVRWFLGDIESCVGQVANLHWDLPVEDNGMGIFVTRQGRSAFVHSSWTEWQEYFSLEIYGSAGLVQVENRLPAVRTTLVSRDGARQVFDFAGGPLDSYDLELGAYLADRAAGVTPSPCGADGVRVLEMAHALYESSRSGRRVQLDTGDPNPGDPGW